jgi:uroporphyrin-III C-methyltransferase/precorrin-2 dehydrogenase/sirohydrochlorin ferrochelatase
MENPSFLRLPIGLSVAGCSVLIIGAGAYGLRKAKLLLEHGAEVTVLSKEFLGEFATLPVQCILKSFEPKDLELKPWRLVFACTQIADINLKVLQAAREQGILCSAAHHKEHSDFTSPATLELPGHTIALHGHRTQVQDALHLRAQLKALFSEPEHPRPKVFLIGFGPGNPDLMTLRAHKLLLQADQILYDDLIDPSLLEHYPGHKTYVGKREGKHGLKQEEINTLLAELALQGNRVARVKGGDPFVFGRGGEELLHLSALGIPVEIVPGVTSAFAAAATAQVPLTHRGIARSLTLQTAHKMDGPETFFPTGGTLVLYMGANRLELLAQKLQESGWPGSTPVVIVRAASSVSEEIVCTQIQDLAQVTLKSPLSIIVGEVGKASPKFSKN